MRVVSDTRPSIYANAPVVAQMIPLAQDIRSRRRKVAQQQQYENSARAPRKIDFLYSPLPSVVEFLCQLRCCRQFIRARLGRVGVGLTGSD